ncbi:MAG TPA: glycoside hydrolase family 16 protein [Candidatus Eisenbacteria bacterium]|nr:glycoside hydrolase family 16 protein [Candidatus Eisenbacteria bacterium]
MRQVRLILTFIFFLFLVSSSSAQQTSATLVPNLIRNSGTPMGNNPALGFTHIPAWGTWGDPLQGQAYGVNPSDFQVTVVILIEGLGWYAKPYCDYSLTHAYTVPLDSNGHWSASITTGGVDQTAIKIAAYLIPKTYTPPCSYASGGLPSEVDANSVAHVLADRQNPNVRELSFSNRVWWVKANSVKLGPGPNFFSDSTENVWVDSQGYLHLRITYRNGAWYCPEIISKGTLGFGTNYFVLGAPVDGLDPNVVFGLFTYSDTDAADSNREIDIEFSKFGNGSDTNNAQYTVQPYTLSQNFHRFQMPTGVPQSTHILQWQPSVTFFKSVRGTDLNAPIGQWTYDGTSFPPGDQNIRMNLWLLNGQPPTNGQEVEVIVQAYGFAPYIVPQWLILAPPVVFGGNPSFGRVGLNAPAPEGGVTISLVSSNPMVARVPSTAEIPAGQSWAWFTVRTLPPTQVTIVTITARTDGSSRLSTLTVKP